MAQRIMLDSDIYEMIADDQALLDALTERLDDDRITLLGIEPQREYAEGLNEQVTQTYADFVTLVPEPLEGWDGNLTWRESDPDTGSEGGVDYAHVEDEWDRLTALLAVTAEAHADIFVTDDDALVNYLRSAAEHIEVWDLAALQDYLAEPPSDAQV